MLGSIEHGHLIAQLASVGLQPSMHKGPQADTDSGPPGDTPGETPEQMTARVDRVIAKIRKIHAEAEAESDSPEQVDHSDVIIFSHGHFTRSFIARWCDFPISAGYHFSADAGGVSNSRICGGRSLTEIS